jgi:rhodanese-related sulfurtransferase
MDGDALHQTKKGHELKIEYSEKDGVKTAQRIIEKSPVKIAKEMLISTVEVQKLVSLGPVKGKYFLFDSRPLPRFQEGAIPGAVNLPYPAFDRLTGKLPADKNALIIFYCAGVNCSMSPGSADKAKKLGYTNLKVYREGIPGWSQKNYTVLSAQSLKEGWIDKERPQVLLDLRSADDAARGFITGAVSFPGSRAAKLINALPPKEKKPPIVLYDAKDGKQAATVAKALLKAGYADVKVLQGGIEAWKAANYETVTGKLPAKASYIPKPRPGEIDLEQFKKDLLELPADVIILDVRNPEEVKTGMLNVAKNIPAEEIKDRLAEIPRDKEIVTQCSTGVRAEMVYHALKELGYNRVSFLNAKVEFDKAGKYTITKE